MNLIPSVNDLGNICGTVDIDLTQSESHITKLTLCGDLTLVFNSIPKNIEMMFEIEFEQDGMGGRHVTWPSSLRNIPKINEKPNSISIVDFRSNGSGNIDVFVIPSKKKWWEFWK